MKIKHKTGIISLMEIFGHNFSTGDILTIAAAVSGAAYALWRWVMGRTTNDVDHTHKINLLFAKLDKMPSGEEIATAIALSSQNANDVRHLANRVSQIEAQVAVMVSKDQMEAALAPIRVEIKSMHGMAQRIETRVNEAVSKDEFKRQLTGLRADNATLLQLIRDQNKALNQVMQIGAQAPK